MTNSSIRRTKEGDSCRRRNSGAGEIFKQKKTGVGNKRRLYRDRGGVNSSRSKI